MNAISNTPTLLSRLEGVRQSGPNRWLARCPAHHDKNPSLSVRELDDGRTLLHCFAGCDTAAVLAAVGLEFSDLYPPRPATTTFVKPERQPFNDLDVLKALAYEVEIVMLAAFRLVDAGDLVLGESDFTRLQLAHSRIQSALSLTRSRYHG